LQSPRQLCYPTQDLVKHVNNENKLKGSETRDQGLGFGAMTAFIMAIDDLQMMPQNFKGLFRVVHTVVAVGPATRLLDKAHQLNVGFSEGVGHFRENGPVINEKLIKNNMQN